MQSESCMERDRRAEKTGKREFEVENIFKIYCLKYSKNSFQNYLEKELNGGTLCELMIMVSEPEGDMHNTKGRK